MPLDNGGFQITFTRVASNTYAVITVGQFETGLVSKHYIFPLNMPLQSEALVVFGQGKPTHWNVNHYFNPQENNYETLTSASRRSLCN